MVKGWNRNRGWNNGWGASRKNRNGTWDLTWANHTEIVTERRVLNAPIARRDEMTEGPVPIETERTGMDRTSETQQDNRQTSVLVNLDLCSQIYMWTPGMNAGELEEWFRGLSGEAKENLWADPRTLPGRVEQIALARSLRPTHMLEIKSKTDFLFREIKDGVRDADTICD